MTIRTKSLRSFIIYSLSLVGIQYIPILSVLFLEFVQPHIEKFDLTIFKKKKKKKRHVLNIYAKMICLHSIPSREEWVLVMHNSQHSHENSGSLREFPDKSLT